MSSKSTLDWLPYIERALLECDQIPMMGEIPPFSWDEVTALLSETFGIDHLQMEVKEWSWIHGEKIKDLLGDHSTCVNISVLPLHGKVSCLLSDVDLNSLIIWLTEKRAGAQGIIPTHFKNGFLNYVCVELLHRLQNMPFFDGFLLRKLSDHSVSTSRSLSLDLQMRAYGETLNLRLLVPEAFRKHWIQHFLQRPTSWTDRKLGHLELECSLQVGHFFHSLEDWKHVQVGDFIPVPSIRIDPSTFSGSLNLTLGQKPLFRVRLKDQGFKILEQMHFEEESTSMDDDTFEDENFSEDFSSEPPIEQEKPAPVSDEMDFLDEDSEEAPPLEAPSTKKTTLSKISDIPLNVSVELTRFHMSCSKLLQLKPGNLLELNIPPEKPVDLVVNGKVIAQGELVQIGEVMGVRILNRN